MAATSGWNWPTLTGLKAEEETAWAAELQVMAAASPGSAATSSAGQAGAVAAAAFAASAAGEAASADGSAAAIALVAEAALVALATVAVAVAVSSAASREAVLGSVGSLNVPAAVAPKFGTGAEIVAAPAKAPAIVWHVAGPPGCSGNPVHVVSSALDAGARVATAAAAVSAPAVAHYAAA